MGQSRTEDILENMLGASNPLPEPQSREESLLQQILEAGGGGGATALSGLSDVDLSSPSDGQVLKYNNTSQKWENADESGGGGGSSHSYSTDEQEVGTWIDGSKVYEKTAYESIGGSLSYDTGIQNIKIISIKGGVCDQNMRNLIPFGYGSNVNAYCGDERHITIENGYASSGRNKVIIIYQYTKP